MKNKAPKRLKLKKETLRALNDAALATARGGGLWIRILDAVTILCSGDSRDCGRDSGGIRG